MKQTSKLGLYIMFGLIIGAFLLGRYYKSAKAQERYVTVKGLCEREVRADKAICPIAFRLSGNNISLLYEQTEDYNHEIVRFILSHGIPQSQITIAAPQLNDRTTEWNSGVSGDRYVMTSVVTVCSDSVASVIRLEQDKGQLLLSNIPLAEMWEYRTEYSFTALNDIKPEMVAAATRNARETAKKFAKDSRSRLGKIRRASQGQFVITDRDANTPYIKNVRVVSSIDYFLRD